MIRRFGCMLAIFGALVLRPCVAGELTEIATSPDRVTEEALRASLLGDNVRLIELSMVRESVEREAARNKQEAASLSENIATLAATTTRPVLDRQETIHLIEHFHADQECETVLRVLEHVEPREQFLDARANRQYESRRRVFNSVTGSIASVLQLQFFGLLQPPLDLAEYLVVGRNFVNPEQRRELYTARLVQALPEGTEKPEAAEKAVDSLTAKRLETAKLHAVKNAERAVEMNRLNAADWWYRRELLLDNRREPQRPEHHAVLEDIHARRERQALRLSVRDGEEDYLNGPIGVVFESMLRQLIINPTDPQLRRDATKITMRGTEHSLADEASLVAALQANASNDSDVARREFDSLAARTETYWGAVMAEYLRRPDFTPSVAFDNARAAISHRKWAFLLRGEDPRIGPNQYSPEEARLIEASWIQAARSVFIFDILSRAISLPLLPSNTIPRDEMFDAARSVPASYWKTEEGQRDMEDVANAYRKAKRFGDAAAWYDRAGDRDKANAMRQKAAARLERAADAISVPELRASMLKRNLNAYPQYKKRERVQTAYDEALQASEIVATITRRELETYPELWNEEGLFLDSTLLDANKKNGEIGPDGLDLLTNGRASYIDADTGQAVEWQLAPETANRTLMMLYPRRRVQAVREELDKPRERKRIPLAVEGSAFPSFDIAPGLVPLDSDRATRRLYE